MSTICGYLIYPFWDMSYIYLEVVMSKRYKMKNKKSRKQFRRTVDRTHTMNVKPRPMRGGTRL